MARIGDQGLSRLIHINVLAGRQRQMFARHRVRLPCHERSPEHAHEEHHKRRTHPPAGTARGLVRSYYAARLLTYLMVMGPGLIVMEADNDAGAVSASGVVGPLLAV